MRNSRPGRPLRIYAETSVFGGVFDEEFARASRAFFEQVREGRFLLVVSPVVQREILKAPADVRAFLADILPETEMADVTDEAIRLRDAYLAGRIVSGKSSDDALHAALATVSGCSLIVSWNFKHIVHFDKIPLYNLVNEAHGYRPIAIYSPNEVIAYEDENL